MNSTLQRRLRRTGSALALLMILYFVGPWIIELISRTFALSMFLVNVLLPVAFFLVLGWFAYSVFLKRYLRVWRIKRIREARYLREVLQRGRKEN